MSKAKPLAAHGAHHHVVEFYESESFLVETVARFAGSALGNGDAVIIVATAAHRMAFEAALCATGVDLRGSAATGRYQALDAAETLATFMVGGAPDTGRFARVIGGLVSRASAGGRRVQIYGEMVALLCQGHDFVSAVTLEGLWNSLASSHRFELLCAYPMEAFANTASTGPFRQICERHSTVVPARDYSLPLSIDGRQRKMASLHQEITALRGDLEGLRSEMSFVVALAGERSSRTGVDHGGQRSRRVPPPGSLAGRLATIQGQELALSLRV